MHLRNKNRDRSATSATNKTHANHHGSSSIILIALLLHCTVATHQLGGTLDAVITRKDAGRPERVDVVDVGVSDHHLPSSSSKLQIIE